MDFVNSVNYKVCMEDKLKNYENEAQIINNEDLLNTITEVPT